MIREIRALCQVISPQPPRNARGLKNDFFQVPNYSISQALLLNHESTIKTLGSKTCVSFLPGKIEGRQHILMSSGEKVGALFWGAFYFLLCRSLCLASYNLSPMVLSIVLY